MQKIIIPTDFSELSEYGLSLAVKVADHTPSELHLLHVINLPSHVLLTNDGELMEDGEMDISIPKKQKEEALAKLETIKSNTKHHVSYCVCFGHVNEEVVKYAEKTKADLIVMGTHGATGVKELINGSHAEYVAMHAEAPVFSLKCDRSDMEIKSIVLAGSFKEDDIPHCEMVVKMQHAFNAKLHLLRINTKDNFISDGEAIAHMKAFAARHELTNVTYAVYNDNDVEEGIIHYAAKENIDVIAIGSMQRTGLNKFIHGCVSADLVNHVFKPLLTFKLKN